MKRLLFSFVLILLALAGCGAPPAQTAAPPPAPPEAANSDGQTSSAAEPDREETTVLTFTVEGENEEVPATLAIRQGYSIYIPNDGWHFETEDHEDGAVYEDSWESVSNDDVKLGVKCYEGMSLAETKQFFIQDEEDYLFEDLMGGGLGDFLAGYDAEDKETLCFMAAEQDGKVYVVYWKYPDQAAEGFGARMPVIANTFALMD